MNRKRQKMKKNRLDEMQEQKMLHIEHNGFWFGYIGLAVVILAQMIYYGPAHWNQYGGEFIIFMFLSVYTMAGCIKYGVWDRKFAPSWRVNLYASLIAGVIGGTVNFFIAYAKYHSLQGSAASGVVMGIDIFVCTLLVMSLALAAYKLREKKLEGEDEDNEEGMRK